MMQAKVDESIPSTITSLNEAFQKLKDNSRSIRNSINDVPPSIFTDEKVLARPPFAYIHALVKFFVQQKQMSSTSLARWSDLLFGIGATTTKEYANNDFQRMQQCLTKKEKLTFLMRLLALVSKVTNKRLDILLSPSKILCGQDVLLTHELILGLASCAMNLSEDIISKAVQYVLDEGDATLYKRGVRSRKAFTCMQAIVRGWLVRRQYPVKRSIVDTTITIKEAVIEAECSIASDSTTDLNEEADSAAGGRAHKSNSRPTTKIVSADEEALLESYQAMLSRKSDVEDQLKVAEGKLQRENGRLIRMLNLGTAHKTRTSVAPYASVPRPPMSAPSIGGMSSDIAVAHTRLPRLDETFRDTITNFSERQRTIKQKERRIDERESKIKQRFAKSKQKEAELKLQEERITDLASKIRKQQINLKEQRLEFERSQLIKPDTPPETTRPCVLCTEKKIQMREIRTKIRQRTRTLNEREAVVIERAHELRRRETQLVKREKIMVELEQQSTVVDELLADYSHDEQQQQERPSHPRHNEKRREKNNNKEPNHETKTTKDSLPAVRRGGTINNRPRSREGRKRRRERSPPESSTTTSTPIDEVSPADSVTTEEVNPVDYEVNVERNSMRAALGEIIPTIIEESPADEHEEDQSSSDDSDNETAPMSSLADSTALDAIVKQSAGCSGVVISNENVPADINKVRQQLGISKSKTAVPRRSTIKLNKQDNEATAQPRIERRISQPPPPKERHVFTFERRDTQNKMSHNRHLHSSESTRSSASSSSFMPDIDGDRGRVGQRISKTKSVVQSSVRGKKKQSKTSSSTREKKQHDDWISSFDAQIKKIMGELEQQSTVVDGSNATTSLLTDKS